MQANHAPQRFGMAGEPRGRSLLHRRKQKAAGRVLLTFGLLMFASLLAGCAHERKEAKYQNLKSDAALSVVISNQCAVVRLATGYIAVCIVKDSPAIFYGAYFSEKSAFGWPRPTADGVVTNSGTITVRGTRVRLRSVGEFEAEVALLDSDDVTMGIAVAPVGGVGDIHADQLIYRTKRVLNPR